MASSNQPNNIVQNKLCSRCTKRKSLNEFIRFYRNQEKEFSICNYCSEKKKGKRPLALETVNEDNETLNQPEYSQNMIINPEEEINNDDEDSVIIFSYPLKQDLAIIGRLERFILTKRMLDKRQCILVVPKE